MDFFLAQDQARQRSWLLLVLFALALLATVTVVYAGLVLLGVLERADGERPGYWDGRLFVAVLAPVGGLILLLATWKSITLARGGGVAVAETLGARRLSRASREERERRLANVVDEMAIAAGLPAPPIYVMDGERGINAFAAGALPRQAVIAVSRGALEQLDRAELQGVVAHEFAHVQNGDMRLNLRLMGLLHGLLALALLGRVSLLGARRAGRLAPLLALLGLVLVVAGSTGVLAGRIIKAAVSRQREFLADAAAVQLTRDPEGLAGALEKLQRGGSRLQHPEAEAISHMLFDSGAGAFRLFATHPPLSDRLRRLRPRLAAARAGRRAEPGPPAAGPLPGVAGLAPVGAGETPAPALTPATHPPAPGGPGGDGAGGEALRQAQAWQAALPPALREDLRQSFDAQAVALALLLPKAQDGRNRAQVLIAGRLGEALAARTLCERGRLDALSPAQRPPLVDLAVGALGELAPDARRPLVETARAVARVDGRISLQDYLLLRALADALLPAAAAAGRRLEKPASLAGHCRLLLSLLAHAGQGAPALREAAFQRGMAHMDWAGEAGSLLPLAQLRTQALDAALDALAHTTPAFRRRFLAALAAVVQHDGHSTLAEALALRTLRRTLDCPLPFSLPDAPAVGTTPVDGP